MSVVLFLIVMLSLILTLNMTSVSTPLLRPPDGADIGLMWMMESYSLRQSRLTGTYECGPLSNATVWQLCSAMSQYITWDTMVSQPSAYFDKERRLIYQACRPTDRVGCSLYWNCLSDWR